jgi:hypothetical protein
MADPPRAEQPVPRADRPAAPRQRRRVAFESAFQRLVATAGVIGLGVALAAILGSQHVKAWIVGLVVSILSVVLTGVLWSREP